MIFMVVAISEDVHAVDVEQLTNPLLVIIVIVTSHILLCCVMIASIKTLAALNAEDLCMLFLGNPDNFIKV